MGAMGVPQKDRRLLPPTADLVAYVHSENPFLSRYMLKPYRRKVWRLAPLTKRMLDPTGFNRLEVRPFPTHTKAYAGSREKFLTAEHMALVYLALRDWNYPQACAARVALAFWREGWRPCQLGSQAFL